MKIISFVPSATEMVCALGAMDDLVGISHDSDYPIEVLNKPKVSRSTISTENLTSEQIDELINEFLSEKKELYEVDKLKIQELNPDVVILQGLCDVCSIPSFLVEPKSLGILNENVKIVNFHSHNIYEMLRDILTLGKAINKENKALVLVESLNKRIQNVKSISSNFNKKRVFCCEWLKPLYNSGHWMPEMVELAGGYDGLAKPNEYSCKIDFSKIEEFNPQVVILGVCGYSVQKTIDSIWEIETYDGWSKLNAVKNRRVYAVDGNCFSRPGPRLVDGLEILAKIIHPEAFTYIYTEKEIKKVY